MSAKPVGVRLRVPGVMAGIALGLLSFAWGCSGSTEPEGPRLTRILIRPPSSSGVAVLVGDSVRLTASGLDQFGEAFPLEGTTWSVVDPDVAGVSQDGWLAGRSHGTTTVSASSNGVATDVPVSVGGVLHTLPIVSDETWRASDNPHVVASRLPVGGAGLVTLTIEPGAEVRFRRGGGLDVGVQGAGRLIVGGAGAESQFVGDVEDVGSWFGLTFRGEDRSELRNVALSHCGGTGDGVRGCIVLLEGASAAPEILVEDVTVNRPATVGVVLERRARFAQGSARLNVLGGERHIAHMSVAAVPNFPVGGDFIGSEVNSIFVIGDTVRESFSWPDARVPWHVRGPVVIEGPQAPVLTIEPGAHLVFEHDVGISVGTGEPGGLVIGALGGPTTRLVGTDGGLHWSGLEVGPFGVASRVEQTTFRRCRECLVVTGDELEGLRPDELLVDSVSIVDADRWGLGLFHGGRLAEGSRGLTITGTAGVPIAADIVGAASIPVGRYEGNQYDAVTLFGQDVRESVTLHDPGIPFSVAGLLVEGASGPTLSLGPGVTLRFVQDGYLWVGLSMPGGLEVLGTSDAPVSLIGESDPDVAGFWGGVHFLEYSSIESRIDHALIRNAGATGAGVQLSRDLGGFLTRTTISLSSGCGVLRNGEGPWPTDLTAPELGNAFTLNLGPPQCDP